MRKCVFPNVLTWWLTITFAGSAVVAQEEGPGSKRVNASGKVINSVTGRPIPNLRLHMGCSIKTGLGGSYDAVTNEQGAFIFTGVPDDVCAISIEGRGLSAEYHYHHNAADKEEPWIIQLIPAVVILGTVVDEKGSPIWSATVFLGTRSLTSGRWSERFTQHTYTDRQGRFRFELPQERNGYQINEERYRLCAEYPLPVAEHQTAYPLSCFPAVSDRKEAEWIELHPGQSREITLRLTPVPAGAIFGKVTNPQPLTRVWLSHVDRLDFSYGGPPVPDPSFNPKTSRFELVTVLPGKYRIRAEGETRGAVLTAAVDVEVRSGEVTNVQLSLTPEPMLRGRLRTDDGSSLGKGEYRRLYLKDPQGVNSASYVAIPDDGFFQVTLRKLSSYRLAFDVLAPWHVASATLQGRDALAEDVHVSAEEPLGLLDVVLSRSVGAIEGSVASREGKDKGVVLLLQRVGSRVENALHLIDGTAHVNIPASFEWNRIPPGAYWVFATPSIDVPFLDIEFLKQYKEFIQEVDVRQGRTSRVELKLLELR